MVPIHLLSGTKNKAGKSWKDAGQSWKKLERRWKKKKKLENWKDVGKLLIYRHSKRVKSKSCHITTDSFIFPYLHLHYFVSQNSKTNDLRLFSFALLFARFITNS